MQIKRSACEYRECSKYATRGGMLSDEALTRVKVCNLHSNLWSSLWGTWPLAEQVVRGSFGGVVIENYHEGMMVARFNLFVREMRPVV